MSPLWVQTAINSKKIELTDTPSSDDLAAIFKPLVQFTADIAGPPRHQPLAVLLRDDNGAVTGGLWGQTVYSWLQVMLLFVPAPLRGKGVGTALVAMAEATARGRGCIAAEVDAYDFQAAGFYERLGYTLFAVQNDHPPGHKRHFYSKKLRDA